MTTQSLAVYVHWPWCKAKCPYCDFNSHAGAPREQDYVNALLKEFSYFSDSCIADTNKTPTFSRGEDLITSLFFGGGTPSLMSPNSIGQLIEGVKKIAPTSDDFEVTLECNPTSFDDATAAQAFFKDIKRAGINRVSIGIQGLKQEWLHFLGREHTVDDALATLDAAQTVFANVNADIIYGLPNQSPTEWEDLLKFLIKRKLNHISAYQLTIEPNTAFFSAVKRGAWTPVTSDQEADFFEITRSTLREEGYLNYEISNFCLPGHECRHNLHIWRYGDYAGFGAGAHGRLTAPPCHVLATRVLKHPETYLRHALSDISQVSHNTLLTPTEGVQEAIFAGLRLREGVDMEVLAKRFSNPICEAAIDMQEVAFLIDKGLLKRTRSHLALTDTGWPLLNSILQRILPSQPAFEQL